MSTSIKNIKVSIQQGEQSLTAVVQAFLDKTAKSKTNSFVETFNEEALAAAIKIEAKIKNGSAGKLAGLVIGLKDNICYKNHIVTAS